MKREIEKDLKTDDQRALYEAVQILESPDQVMRFLRDLLTFDEIREISKRFAVVKMLNDKKTVREISKKTKMSSATISRINFWLHHGTGGYRLVLEKLKK